ncbi:hypothetical protein ACTI_33630 [Actinoplanes sp. OR16]|uniref:hypothetical protein n=1 Tax=Actinoplanes sp. OR16 TaxID=946334 RepID=UPI000F6F1F96|nr:hypothetical protein [Actinoplanes sp. OR16]BBH66678.1 hypothetical protein ACTI_33630 [Actinoplanes sp. OR16]
MATYDEWLETFSDAYDMAPEAIDLACPNCGRQRLRLVFTARPDRSVGHAAFWCDHCLQGIGISRAVIPAEAIVRDSSVPADEREPKIPNFQLAT